MQKVFDQFAGASTESAVIDWIVFATGVLLLAVSVVLSFSGGDPDRISQGAVRDAPNVEIQLPS